jgi:hypothetical protein
MQIAIAALLEMLQLIAPGATADLIVKIVTVLEAWIPIIIKEATDLTPIVKNVIAALRGNGTITTEQLDQLDTMEATLDAAFDKAISDAEAADKPG